MKTAWEEEAKNLVETGTNKEIQKYFDNTPYENDMKNGTKNESQISWCASFVNWVMENNGMDGVDSDSNWDSVRALKWADWKNGKKIDNPVYGAMAVKKRNGGGHIGFVVGKKGNKLVILGGNQGNKLNAVTYEKSAFHAFVVPVDYPIDEYCYNLNEFTGNPENNSTEN